ncbi:MAG TPA: 4-(cytidine 5'-diphospho)-2-C-methyl-D-erythritol kinase [Gemmatimonadaceae bacterium]|nr:4-(cytidine 5'-diphospho)-2-C-methyl-D-erythritol kinase [Gemmatimonadaceae bacterium]
MSLAARVRAQAKINLILRVLAREASGFHSIETVFLRLDLSDEISLRVTSGRSLDCSGPALPVGGLGPVERNLAYRAADEYARVTGWPAGFAIEIEKHIPIGGGLGGGSADAGAVLRALDALSPNPLGPRLVELAAGLGADVPFMSIDSPMSLAWGRGERLYPLRPLESRPILLAVPDFGIATADAYAWLAASRGQYAPVGAVLAADSLATWEEVAREATNDFEAVVARRHPIIADLIDRFRSMDALVAMLSGSGSTVFGVFDEAPDRSGVSDVAGLRTVVSNTSDRVSRVERTE